MHVNRRTHEPGNSPMHTPRVLTVTAWKNSCDSTTRQQERTPPREPNCTTFCMAVTFVHIPTVQQYDRKVLSQFSVSPKTPHKKGKSPHLRGVFLR